LTLGGISGTGVVSTTVSIFEKELALYTGGGVASLIDCVVSRIGPLVVSLLFWLNEPLQMSALLHVVLETVVLTMRVIHRLKRPIALARLNAAQEAEKAHDEPE
jgi:hypothetical protein